MTPRDRVYGPVAAELDVIDQPPHISGPTRMSANPEPEGKDGETLKTLSMKLIAFCLTLMSYRPQLATFDGNDDWDSFLLSFECQARKYRCRTAQSVDWLHECLRGTALRYVCSLQTAEDFICLVN